MALTLGQQHLLAMEAAFVNRCALAMAGYADNVMAENQAGMTQLSYEGQSRAAARTSLAVAVIRNAHKAAEDRRYWLAAQAAALDWPGNALDMATVTLTDTLYANFMQSSWDMLAGWRAAAF